MNRSDIEKFEKAQAQLEGLHSEIQMLCKKNPKDAVNVFKLGLINKVLGMANVVLKKGYRPFDSFVSFNESDLPNNGDVAMILSQYLSCMEELRSDNIGKEFDDWFWLVDGVISGIPTGAPKKIKGR